MSWSPLQNGIGIDIQSGNLEAVCVKRQWKRIHVVDRLVVPGYREAGPHECGRLWRDFLRRNGLRAPWTVVALPRSAVLLRLLSFPTAVEKDLAQAVAFQLDSLHPFEEGGIYWDFASWKTPQGETAAGGGIEAPVVIAEKRYVDETAAWFQEAGIGVTQFTVTTAVLMSVLGPHFGVRGAPRFGTRTAPEGRSPRPFFILHARPGTLEVTGYAPGAFVSREIPVADESGGDSQIENVKRQIGLVRSELRLDPQEQAPLVACGNELPWLSPALADDRQLSLISPDALFPALNPSAGIVFHLQESLVPFAAAVSAADHALPFSLNLLPSEKRSYESPAALVPAYALAGLIVLLAVALGVRGTIQDWQYSRYLQRETVSLRPQLQQVEKAQDQSKKVFRRLALLGGIRDSSGLPIEILEELTRLLPEDVWIQSLQYDSDTLSITGFAKSASALLQTLSESSHFENPQFLSAISRTPEGKEGFRIGIRLKRPVRQ